MLKRNSAISFLVIYPRKIKTYAYIQKNLYKNIFINIIDNDLKYKQSKHPATSEWVNILWSITQWNITQKSQHIHNMDDMQEHYTK